MVKLGKQKVENLSALTVNELAKLTGENQNIGTPIPLEDGSLIIPVSKTLIGYLSGGGEYGQVKLFDKNKPFLGGGDVHKVFNCGTSSIYTGGVGGNQLVVLGGVTGHGAGSSAAGGEYRITDLTEVKDSSK